MRAKNGGILRKPPLSYDMSETQVQIVGAHPFARARERDSRPLCSHLSRFVKKIIDAVGSHSLHPPVMAGPDPAIHDRVRRRHCPCAAPHGVDARRKAGHDRTGRPMIAVFGGLADVERDLNRARTGEGGGMTAYRPIANMAGGMDFRPPFSLNDPKQTEGHLPSGHNLGCGHPPALEPIGAVLHS